MFPDGKDLQQSLHLHMRKAGGFNTKTAATIAAALEQDTANTTVRDPVKVWPENGGIQKCC